MSDFEQIPEIAERIKRSKMELKENGFYWSPEWDSQSCCDQDFVNNFKKGWHSRQDEVDALQKRVDAAKQLIEDLNKCYQQDHQNKFEYWRGFADSAGILGKRLEQALKGGDE